VIGKRRDGSTFDTEISLTAIAEGGLICVCRDISERKRAEEALRESEEKFRSLVENAPDFIAIVNAAGKILFINRTAPGFTIDEVIGASVFDYISTEHHELIRKSIKRVFHTGKPDAFEVTAKAPHGSTSWYSTRVGPIKRDGQIFAVTLISTDITERRQTEQELRKLASIVEHTESGVVISSGDTFELVNPAFARMHGYAVEELIGTPIAQAFAPEFRAQVPEHIRVAKERGRLTFEAPHLRKDGTVFPALIQVTAVRDEQGKPLHRIATVIDITERKRAEEALQESEARFRTLVEHAPETICVLDVDTGRFVDANENAVKFFGLEREALFKVGPEDMSPPTLPDGRASRAFIQEKVHETLAGGTPVVDWVHRNAAGDDIPCEVRLVRLPAAGRNLVRGSIIDISERKRAEDKLRRYTKRLENLQEIDRAVLAARSPEKIAQAALHHIQDLMPCFRASVVVFDFETKEGVVIATQVRRETKIGTGARWPITEFELVETLEQGKPVVVDDLLSRPLSPIMKALQEEGVRSYINVPLISKGEFIGTVNLASDKPGDFSNEDVEIAREIANSLAIAIQQARLHEQVQRHAVELEQRVAERTAELEAFSYSVSHDLRSPLRAIDGFSRILQEDHAGMLDAECNRLLSIIRSNTLNMAQLIDDLLAFSRIGRKELQRIEVDMTELAKTVWEELKAATPGRKLHVKIMPLPVAHGDRAMLRQVFVNLLANAIKFTRPRETAMIEVGAGVEGNQNVYYVKDNGVGFAMQYVHKLFGVFQRLHGAEEFEGTGVGLAIVQRIIQRHCGRVWAKGQVDEGAAIYFTLPSKGMKL
jgi:PAS domain S-box-containing protein